MSIVIEHEKRKREILDKAMDVFVEDGFGRATIQKIAERCGIGRPLLYTYFKNKRALFNYSIKQLLSSVEESIARELEKRGAAAKNGAKPRALDTLRDVMTLIIDILERNKKLLDVLFEYFIYIRKRKTPGAKETPDYLVRKRTLKLRHILSEIVIDGIKSGEIARRDVAGVNNLLYALLESAILNMAVLDKPSAGVKQTVRLAVRLLGS